MDEENLEEQKDIEILDRINKEEDVSWRNKIPIEERLRVNKLPYKLPPKLTFILDGLKWAIHFKRQSGVLIIDGRSGMGKTTLSFQIGNYMTEDFTLDNVFFTPESFLQGLSVAKKGQVLIFDEAMLLSSRAALSAINKMIVVAMSMIRSKNLIIIFNVNSIFDLDRNLALSRADLLLHCYGDSLTDKGKFLAFFKGADGMDRIKSLYINGKKYYSYSTPKANFYSVFSSHFVLDEEEYEKRKQVGVDRFLTGKKLDTVTKDKRARDNLICHFKYELGYTLQQIADIVKLDVSTISLVLKKDRERKELENNPEYVKMVKEIQEKMKIEENLDD